MADNASNIGTAAQSSAVKQAPVTLRIILGEKIGMTQVFDEKGFMRPVTVVKAGPCVVANVRTPERDGYSSVCLGFKEADIEDMNKALAGQFKKSGVSAVKYLKEFRVSDVKGFEVGQIVSVGERFKQGDYIDVQGLTKGRGFAGGMKRHGFHGLPASHGASDKERSPGSLASRRSLGRVIPGQRMAGHYGQDMMTVTKLEVVKVDSDNNLIYICGALPGVNGGMVTILETTRPRKHRIEHQVAKSKTKIAAKGSGAKKPEAKK